MTKIKARLHDSLAFPFVPSALSKGLESTKNQSRSYMILVVYQPSCNKIRELFKIEGESI